MPAASTPTAVPRISGCRIKSGVTCPLTAITARTAACVSSRTSAGGAANAPSATEKTPSKANVEAATRLQIFLDRANFSPGKLDGHYGDFTWKALALYRVSLREQPQQPPPSRGKSKTNFAPDITGLDLAGVGPV